jgi:hypothetical protein
VIGLGVPFKQPKCGAMSAHGPSETSRRDPAKSAYEGQSGRAVDIVRGPSLIRRFPAPPKFGSDWREADMQRASRARPMLCLATKTVHASCNVMFGRSTLQAAYKSRIFHRQRSDVVIRFAAATGSVSWHTPRAVQPVFSIGVALFVALSSLAEERDPRDTPLFGAPDGEVKCPR